MCWASIVDADDKDQAICNHHIDQNLITPSWVSSHKLVKSFIGPWEIWMKF